MKTFCWWISGRPATTRSGSQGRHCRSTVAGSPVPIRLTTLRNNRLDGHILVLMHVMGCNHVRAAVRVAESGRGARVTSMAPLLREAQAKVEQAATSARTRRRPMRLRRLGLRLEDVTDETSASRMETAAVMEAVVCRSVTGGTMVEAVSPAA